MNKASQKFYKYLDEIPTGWEKLLQDLIKAGSAALVTFLNPMAGVVYTSSLYGKDDDGQIFIDGEKTMEETKKKMAYTSDDMIIFKNVESYSADIQKLINFLEYPGDLRNNSKEFEIMRIRMEDMQRT